MNEPQMFDVVLDEKAGALVATMQGIVCVLRAPRKPHGPEVIEIARAAAYRYDDDYYYFGYRSAEAQLEANARILARIEQMRAEDRAKPYRYVFYNLPQGQSLRWLTLAMGRFPFANGESAPREEFDLGGRVVCGPAFGFPTRDEMFAANNRLELFPEWRKPIQRVRLENGRAVASGGPGT